MSLKTEIIKLSTEVLLSCGCSKRKQKNKNIWRLCDKHDKKLIELLLKER